MQTKPFFIYQIKQTEPSVFMCVLCCSLLLLSVIRAHKGVTQQSKPVTPFSRKTSEQSDMADTAH